MVDEVKRFTQLSLAPVSFMAMAFLSCNIAICVMYLIIFASEMGSRRYVNSKTILVSSVLFDAYTSQFVMISFVPFIVLYVLTKKLRPMLKNAKLLAVMYCFFVFLCLAEFLQSLLIFLANANPDLHEHLFRVLMSTGIFVVYCTVGNLFPRIIRH
jgi:hypothetical protein